MLSGQLPGHLLLQALTTGTQPDRKYQHQLQNMPVFREKPLQYRNLSLNLLSPCCDNIPAFDQPVCAACGTHGCNHQEPSHCKSFGRLSSMTHAAAGHFSRLKLPQDRVLTHDIGTDFKCVSCAALAAAATALPLLPTHQQAAITTLPSQATLQNKH